MVSSARTLIWSKLAALMCKWEDCTPGKQKNHSKLIKMDKIMNMIKLKAEFENASNANIEVDSNNCIHTYCNFRFM